MGRLVLTIGQAEQLIYRCEGATDHEGKNKGHTKREHIDASKERLRERFEDGPSDSDRKFVFWRSAFLSVTSAAEQLVKALNASKDAFVVDFYNRSFDDYWSENVPVAPFSARSFTGVFPEVSHVHVYMRKVPKRAHELHLITLYPMFFLGQAKKKD